MLGKLNILAKSFPTWNSSNSEITYSLAEGGLTFLLERNTAWTNAVAISGTGKFLARHSVDVVIRTRKQEMGVSSDKHTLHYSCSLYFCAFSNTAVTWNDKLNTVSDWFCFVYLDFNTVTLGSTQGIRQA